MANLHDLDYDDITSMSTDEAIEKIRQMRLKRRTNITPTKKPVTNKSARKSQLNDIKLSAKDAEEILKLLGEI